MLLAVLGLLHALQAVSITAWMAASLGLALAGWRLRATAFDALPVRLMQLVGSLSAFYALLHYPLMPPMDGIGPESAYAALLLVWLVSMACGVCCWRVPSLAVVAPAYLVWSAYFAVRVTGLYHSESLDMAPLPEVTLCLFQGLLLARTAAWALGRRGGAVRPEHQTAFAQITLSFAIGLHLANYFYSGVAKLELTGPPLAWVTDNNPLYIYLAAIDDGHITFSGHPDLAAWLAHVLDATHGVTNVLVFAAQIGALAGLLMPKRWLIWLLLAFDCMHVSIALAAGANFWPWVLLNIAIVRIVASPAHKQPPTDLAVIATLFIALSPSFGNVARLGWFDSGANNTVSYQAVDQSGRRHDVPPNFFAFYSYPIAHGQYGLPGPERAFATSAPNGGVWDLGLAQAGRACDVDRLVQPGGAGPHPQLGPFIRRYHQLALGLERAVGRFPYNLYPHHFYVRPSAMDDFDALGKDKVVAYIMRRDSVCLSLSDGGPQRRLVSSAEVRIDVSDASR